MRRKNGFTTIELMFVTAVALTVIVAMLVAFFNFMRLNDHNRNLTVAMGIARDKMEEINYKKSTGQYDSIVSTRYNANGLGNPNDLTPYGVPVGWGNCEVAVTEVPDTQNNLKLVRLTISWKERGRTIVNGVDYTAAAARR